MEPDVSFVGIQLMPGKPVAVNDEGDSESQIWTLHITQFALGKQPRAGRNVVSIIKDDGRTFVLGTLEKGRCEQFQADFMISESVQLVVEGESEVHLTGYKTTTELLDPEAEELLGDSEESEDSEDDEDFEDEMQRQGADDEDEDEDDGDEDEEAPDAVPLLTGKQAAQLERKLQALARGAEEEEDEDDIDEEELEEDDEEEGPGIAGLADMDADEDESDDEEEEEEEEEEEVKVPPKKVKRPAEGEAKRPAAATPAAAAKKAKTAATTPGGEAAGEAQWLKDIRAHIAKEGPTSLSAIGASVKKPPNTAKKLKKLLEDSAAFNVGADLVVSLKK